MAAGQVPVHLKHYLRDRVPLGHSINPALSSEITESVRSASATVRT